MAKCLWCQVGMPNVYTVVQRGRVQVHARLPCHPCGQLCVIRGMRDEGVRDEGGAMIPTVQLRLIMQYCTVGVCTPVSAGATASTVSQSTWRTRWFCLCKCVLFV